MNIHSLHCVPLQPICCFKAVHLLHRYQKSGVLPTRAGKESNDLLTNIEEGIRDKEESDSSTTKGFGSPSPKPKKKKQPAQPEKSADKSPFQVSVPDLNKELSISDKVEEAIVRTLGLLFVVFFAEGLYLAIAGFLPEAADDFAVKYVYPAFSPTLGVFLAISVVYGLLKSRQGGQ